MSLHVLLEVLRPLEGLAAEVTLMWLQRDVNADVGRDVVALDGSSAAVAPLAGQIQIIRALAANVTFADMVLVDMLAHCADRFEVSGPSVAKRQVPIPEHCAQP